jgi:hypothetical protein
MRMIAPLFLLELVLLGLLVSFSANAQMYKGFDEEGNTVYSDKPFFNAEKFTPPSLTIVDAPEVTPKEEVIEQAKPPAFKYTAFSIASPGNDEVIWNEPDLIVTLKLKPGLNTEQGHTVWLLMDGKVVAKNSRSLSLPIGRSDRGSHTLQAQIRSKQGKVLKRTRTITVHIKNSTIKRPAPVSPQASPVPGS